MKKKNTRVKIYIINDCDCNETRRLTLIIDPKRVNEYLAKKKQPPRAMWA